METVYVKEVALVRVVLNALNCPACGVVFGITQDFEGDRRKDAKHFYCPNGHSMTYGKTEEERLRDQVVVLRRRESYLKAENERLCNDLMDSAKEAKRLKRRAAAGTCEVCRRTFANKASHMQKQHPEYVESVRPKGNAHHG